VLKCTLLSRTVLSPEVTQHVLRALLLFWVSKKNSKKFFELLKKILNNWFYHFFFKTPRSSKNPGSEKNILWKRALINWCQFNRIFYFTHFTALKKTNLRYLTRRLHFLIIEVLGSNLGLNTFFPIIWSW